MSDTMHDEHSVRTRYAAAAQQSEAALCCPVPLRSSTAIRLSAKQESPSARDQGARLQRHQ